MTTDTAVSELVQAAFSQAGGVGDAGARTLRAKDDMNIQPALFGSMPPQPPQPSPIERRRKAMDEALKNAGDLFKESFTAYVLLFLANGPSDGETIRESYSGTKLPQPHKWQAAGGVYAKLRREGKIVEVGKVRSRIYGNDISQIALKQNA